MVVLLTLTIIISVLGYRKEFSFVKQPRNVNENFKFLLLSLTSFGAFLLAQYIVGVPEQSFVGDLFRASGAIGLTLYLYWYMIFGFASVSFLLNLIKRDYINVDD